MLYFGVNHCDYTWPSVSFTPFKDGELEYTDEHTTGEEYVLVEWNDEIMIVHDADDSLTTLAAKWYNSFNVEEWWVEGGPVGLNTTRGFIDWVNESVADKDSASGFAIFDSKGDMIAGPQL